MRRYSGLILIVVAVIGIVVSTSVFLLRT
jgi:preprotein translocase subunit SecG